MGFLRTRGCGLAATAAMPANITALRKVEEEGMLKSENESVVMIEQVWLECW